MQPYNFSSLVKRFDATCTNVQVCDATEAGL